MNDVIAVAPAQSVLALLIRPVDAWKRRDLPVTVARARLLLPILDD